MRVQEQVERVGSFNRFYTRQIGLLREGLLKTPFSLTQARVLYELGSRPGIRSTDLIRDLGLDPGYLSRLLKGFARERLVKRTNFQPDRRVSLLALTTRGRAQFARLNARSKAEISEMLGGMSGAQRKRLVDSMTAIRGVLERPAQAKRALVIE